MTIAEKNRILELRDSGASVRSIAGEMHMSTSSVHDFLLANADVSHYSACPVCHKTITHHKHLGRRRIYCSDKCRYSSKARKTNIRICQFCRKPFKAYGYSGTRFCSHSCYMRYRYGK